MDTFSNEMILYSGLIVAGVAVLLGVIYSVIHFIGKRRLNAKFDVEYGEVPRKRK